jgi:hypothetical protein
MSLPVVLLLALAVGVPSASATSHVAHDTETWLALSGSTAYRTDSSVSVNPVIYAQNLNTLRRKTIGSADGYVSRYEAAASSAGIAVTASGTSSTTLTIFRKRGAAIKVDELKDGECPAVGPAPFEQPPAPIDLAADGTLTYVKRDASTGCDFRLMRREPNGYKHPLWLPPGSGLLGDYSTIESKGDLVLLSKYDLDATVIDTKNATVVYELPKQLEGFYRVHLPSSRTLGLTYVEGKESSAIRVDLKTGNHRRFEFPHRAEALFCGRFTFFGGGQLAKVYDSDGKTKYRRSPGQLRIFGFQALCSSRFVFFNGGSKGASHGYLLSLTKFKSRKLF